MTPHHRGTRDPRWALLSERADSAFAPDRAQGLHLMPTLAFRPLQACAERYARRLQPSRAGSRVESRGSVFPHRPPRRCANKCAACQSRQLAISERTIPTRMSLETAEPLLRQPFRAFFGCQLALRANRPASAASALGIRRRRSSIRAIVPQHGAGWRLEGICGDRRDRPRGRRDGGSGLQLCRCDGARSALDGRPVRSFDVCDGSSLCSAHGWWDALFSSRFVGLTASAGSRSVPWSSSGGMRAAGTGRERR